MILFASYRQAVITLLHSSGSLCTMLSLQWEPEIIAVAVMYLAGRLCKFDIQDWTPKQSSRRWWEQFVQDVPVELLEGATSEVHFTETYILCLNKKKMCKCIQVNK